MEINYKKLQRFIGELGQHEFRFVELTMQMVRSLTDVIKKGNMSREDVISRFEINELEYEDFIKGNFNYSIRDMATINALFIEFETLELENKIPIKVAE